MTALVCDDDASTRFAVTRLLTRHLACTVIECSTGADALARLDTDAVHLVLLDIQMPDMSGAEVLTAIRASANHRQLPVVMMSRERREEIVMPLVRLGIDGYVLKPLCADKMLAALDPLKPRMARQPGEQAPASQPPGEARSMLVDGDADFRRDFIAQADTLGVVLEADSGSAALTLFRRQASSVVFVGSRLGLLPRQRLVAKLRARAAPRALRIVALADARPDGPHPDGCDDTIRRTTDPAALRAGLQPFTPMPGPLGAGGVRIGDAERCIRDGTRQICTMMLDVAIAETSGRIPADTPDAVTATATLTGALGLQLSATLPVASAMWVAGRMLGKASEATTEADWGTAVGELCQPLALRFREYLEDCELAYECEAPVVRRGPCGWTPVPPVASSVRISFEVPGRGITLLLALDVAASPADRRYS